MVVGLAAKLAVAGGGSAMTVVEPDLVASCTEVAVTVIGVAEEIEPGGMSRPDADMVPTDADQLTAELKLPVPVTVAEHWLVWLNGIVAGVQATRTEVMVGGASAAPILPPQLLMMSRPAERRITIPRIPSSSFVNGYSMSMRATALAGIQKAPILR